MEGVCIRCGGPNWFSFLWPGPNKTSDRSTAVSACVRIPYLSQRGHGPRRHRSAMPPATGRWRRGGRSAPRLLERTLLVAALSAAALIFLLLLQHHHGPKPPNPSSASGARVFSDELPDESLPGERDPEAGDAALSGDGATCATVERMGEEAAAAGRGSPQQASLRIREMIRRHFELQGAFQSGSGYPLIWPPLFPAHGNVACSSARPTVFLPAKE